MYMKICVVGDVLDVITCAKFQNEILKGYDFTGVEFSIFLLILNGPYNSAARYSLLVHKIDDFRFSCSVIWLDPSKIL